MISIKNIRIPYNYVLILPDPDFDTYQFGGKETGIIAPTYTYKDGNRVDAKNKNFATTGTVFGVPDKIRFTREKIKAISASIITQRNGQNVMADSSLLYKINHLKESGCRFETENELQVGDKVKFSYQMHLKAHYFDTQEGSMCFMKYDDIYMTVDGKMINGYILVDPAKRDTVQEGAATFIESKSGLLLPKLGETYKRSARWMEGSVLHAGKPIKGYFDFADYDDEDFEVLSGDKIIFDPRTALQYETNNHLQLADRKLYLIQRKDILFFEKENKHFEKLCTI
jgi:co-chaperonin GroES (HSP10)